MSIGVLVDLDWCRAEMVKASKATRCRVPKLCVAEALIRYVLGGFIRGEAVKVSQTLLKNAVNSVYGISIENRCLEVALGKIRSELITCSRVLMGDVAEFGDGIIVRRWDLIKLVDCLVGNA